MIVVGGGIAGLYVASRKEDAVLLEASSRVGGRVRTVRHRDDSTVLYEAGPWRVHTSHTRVLKLLEELHIELHGGGGELSVHDRYLLEQGVHGAIEQELKSGYEGFHAAADAEARTYDVRHPGGQYQYISGGFHRIVEALTNIIPPRRIHVHHRVTNVRFDSGEYILSIVKREGDAFTNHTMRTLRLVCALPPRETLEWDIANGSVHKYIPWAPPAASHLRSPVDPRGSNLSPYHRYFTCTKLEAGASRVEITTLVIFKELQRGRRTVLAQTHLSKPKKCKELLEKDLKKALRDHLPQVNRLQLKDVHFHYWDHASHYWVPTFGFKSAKEHAKRCIEPHPVQCPQLYWVGEAFSTHQGWVEGALETAEMCLSRMQQSSANVHRISLEDGDCVAIEGRVSLMCQSLRRCIRGHSRPLTTTCTET